MFFLEDYQTKYYNFRGLEQQKFTLSQLTRHFKTLFKTTDISAVSSVGQTFEIKMLAGSCYLHVFPLFSGAAGTALRAYHFDLGPSLSHCVLPVCVCSNFSLLIMYLIKRPPDYSCKYLFFSKYSYIHKLWMSWGRRGER